MLPRLLGEALVMHCTPTNHSRPLGTSTRARRACAVLISAFALLAALAPGAVMAQQVISGNQMIAKTNASVEGCFRAALRSCRSVFGVCQRSPAGVFHVGAQTDVALTCQSVDLTQDALVVMVVSFATVNTEFRGLRARALDMTAQINEAYW